MPTHLGELGEKRLLRELVLPLVNPNRDPMLAGDDCGVVDVPDGHYLCASTDRIPWDLTAFTLGIMGERDLGFYLAVLNISDVAAMGAKPVGLLLNFALPATFAVEGLMSVLSGVKDASARYRTPILGGDLSDAVEPSLSATSIGVGRRGGYLRRAGAEVSNSVYTTGFCGLTATALRYFLDAAPQGLRLSPDDEALLRRQFTNPIPQLGAGGLLAGGGWRATAMDNTDGLGQTVHELAEASSCQYVLHEALLPVHPVSREVAGFLGEDVVDTVTGPGADFNLVGTVDRPEALAGGGLHRIGEVELGEGVVVRYADGRRRMLEPRGWDYYTHGGRN